MQVNADTVACCCCFACRVWVAKEAGQDLIEWSFRTGCISRLDAALVWWRCVVLKQGGWARACMRKLGETSITASVHAERKQHGCRGPRRGRCEAAAHLGCTGEGRRLGDDRRRRERQTSAASWRSWRWLE
jgi:hypothetical protein